MSEKEEITAKEKMYEWILSLPKETGHTGALFSSIFYFPLLSSCCSAAEIYGLCMIKCIYILSPTVTGLVRPQKPQTGNKQQTPQSKKDTSGFFFFSKSCTNTTFSGRCSARKQHPNSAFTDSGVTVTFYLLVKSHRSPPDAPRGILT